MKKNIANDRLKGLKKSFNSEGDKSKTGSLLVSRKNITSRRNVEVESSGQKRKSDSSSEDGVSKRLKFTNSLQLNRSIRNFSVEQSSKFTRQNQQSASQDYKVSRVESLKLPTETNSQSIPFKSPSVGKPTLVTTSECKRNIANERLAKLKNNIHANTSATSKNINDSSSFNKSHSFCKQTFNRDSAGSCLHMVPTTTNDVTRNNITSSAETVHSASPFFNKNIPNCSTPMVCKNNSSAYEKVKCRSISPTRFSQNYVSPMKNYTEKSSEIKHLQAESKFAESSETCRMRTKEMDTETIFPSVLGSENELFGENVQSLVFKNKESQSSKRSSDCAYDISHAMVTEDTPNADSASDAVVNSSYNKGTEEPNLGGKTVDPQDCYEKSEDICIVVDTNIFLSHLKLIRDIVNMPVAGSVKPVIYVPWMVLTELDYMKHHSEGKGAQKAIVYINSLLQAENCRVKGQNIFEVNEQMSIGKSADDKIISCCLQVSKQFNNVILLSNDVNAKTKAIVNGIGACSYNEIIMKLHGLLRKNKKFQKILHKMSVVCSYAICECVKEAYGDVWSKMDLLKDRPWSLSDCLKIFKKYWVAVFEDKVLKQFQVAVNDLLNLLSNKSCLADDTDDFKNFTAICGAICFFLKDIDSLRTIMERTIKEIKDIKNT